MNIRLKKAMLISISLSLSLPWAIADTAYAHDNNSNNNIVNSSTNFNNIKSHNIIKSHISNPMNIIPPDDRNLVTNTTKSPYDNIVNIIMYDGRDDDDAANEENATDAHHKTVNAYSCSGTLIASNVVLTAGHCLYEAKSDNPIRGDFIVIPARNGGSMDKWNNPDYKGDINKHYPLGVYNTTNMWYDRRWVENKDQSHDWGILFLSSNVPGFKSSFSFSKPSIISGTPTTMTGYPGTNPEGIMDNKMYTDEGFVVGRVKMKESDDNTVMIATNDMVHGSSGSPLYNRFNQIIGIASTEETNGESLNNYFKEVDDELIETINRAIN